MQLPDYAPGFIQSVRSESKKLIELGFWDIPMARFEGWFKQFCGPEEEFFSACLLDQLIFRTEPQFESGLRSLFRSNLNYKLDLTLSDMSLCQAFMSYSELSEHRLKLVPVICDSDPPTKSGPLVLRRLQRILKIRKRWMCWPWQCADFVNDGCNVIIFVDDFLGSGIQFEKFFKKWKFNEIISSDVKYFYAPVIAHRQGIEYLKEKLPSVCVVTAEVLERSHCFFSEEVWHTLSQGIITAEEAKAWYLNFVEEKNLCPKTVGALGSGELGVTIGFSHSTPNNTLPILWYETANWQPLLER